jgi:hypothetical protein
MGDGVLALTLMLGGLGCIVAWGACQAVAAIRANRLRREADVIKLHVTNGGRLLDGAQLILARSYLQVRRLGIVGNILLVSGIIAVATAQVVIL